MAEETILDSSLVDTKGVERIMGGDVSGAADIAYGWIGAMTGNTFSRYVPIEHIGVIGMTK